MSKYGVFSGQYFPAFGLNTKRYEVSLAVIVKVNNKSSENMGKTMLKVDTLGKESLKSKMFKQHLFVQIHQWKTPKQYVKSIQS